MAATALGTLLNSFDTEWIGVIHEQAPKFLAGYADETIRNRMLLAYLRKNGRIVLNGNGPMCVWSTKFQQPTPTSVADGGSISFTRQDNKRQLALNWRGYFVPDMMTEKEYLMNKGPGQIFNRYGEVIPDLIEAITDYFGGQLYIDGNATGNENAIHGIESFMGAGTVAVGDVVAQPSDTYAGLSTALGNEGGSWDDNLTVQPNSTISKDWPAGRGTASWDFNSPVLLNWSSNAWGTSAVTWESNCERTIRQGIIWLKNRGGMSGMPKLALMDSILYTGFLNHMSSKQRAIIPHSESQDLGFPDAVNFDGVGLAYDFDCPANTGYLLNIQNVELISLDKVLFGYRGPDWSIRDRAYLFYVGFWGNARWRAKHFGKFFNYAAA